MKGKKSSSKPLIEPPFSHRKSKKNLGKSVSLPLK